MIDSHSMEYNSQKGTLRISEYGRNIQNMLAYARSIDDIDEKRRTVDGIVKLMLQMNPQTKNVMEYQEKLWRHAFYIAEYNLPDIIPPNGVIPTEAEAKKKPDSLEYPAYQTRYRHYGHQVQVLINKAKEMEDPEKKAEFTKVIAAYMKLAYRTWNQDSNVNDNVIKADLKRISDGGLELGPDEAINYLANSYTKPKRNTNTKHGKNKNNRNNNNNKRRRKY